MQDAAHAISASKNADSAGLILALQLGKASRDAIKVETWANEPRIDVLARKTDSQDSERQPASHNEFIDILNSFMKKIKRTLQKLIKFFSGASCTHSVQISRRIDIN